MHFSPQSIRHVLYEQKGGYLIVPILIMLFWSLVAGVLPVLEAHTGMDRCWRGWLAHTDSSIAQLILGAIAGSCITVLSVIYSVLVVALTFASVQFSPRILTIFLKDRVSQATLGIFIGTFAYCLILLPSIRSGSDPYVPPLAITIALLLSIGCIFYLIFFIHHMALVIQANYIVDRIARETEKVLRQQFGPPLKGFPQVDDSLDPEPTDSCLVKSRKTGYIQYVDEDRLVPILMRADVSVYLYRGVGQFIAAGVPLFTISPASRASKKLAQDIIACFFLGPLRSMEDDVQFGMLQLVDIALKAVSPAVNDPSTAISCVDHLSAILVLAASLEPKSQRIYDAKGALRVVRRQPTFSRLLEIAFDQIHPYGKNDMAVSLRLLRALQDISSTTLYPPYLNAICVQAKKFVAACSQYFPQDQCKELFDRLADIESRYLATNASTAGAHKPEL